MNYYKRHLGDYARDTGHLTALEHGIYTLLLDWYYVNECPIPFDKAVRIARGNPEQTQMVLDEFFKRQETGQKGWIHSRADREISASSQNLAASFHGRFCMALTRSGMNRLRIPRNTPSRIPAFCGLRFLAMPCVSWFSALRSVHEPLEASPCSG